MEDMGSVFGQRGRHREDIVVDFDYAPGSPSHHQQDVDDKDLYEQPIDDHRMNFDPSYFDNDNRADGTQDDITHSDSCSNDSGFFYDYHERESRTFGLGDTLFDKFDADKQSAKHKDNLYHPYRSRPDWEMAYWLHESGLSMAKINSFLCLEFIRNLPLSYSTAKKLRSLIELLPAGAKWLHCTMQTTHATKSPVILYYRDAIEVIKAILSSPMLKDVIEWTPYKLYTSVTKAYRVYKEWMSGEYAWKVYSSLPESGSILGIVLGSDKTVVSVMTGNRVTYPLVITLANILMEFRMKTTSNALQLLALLPVAKFIHPVSRIRSLLQDRLVHQCLDVVLEPLKIAAQVGIMVNDPMGYSRYCFTPLASYIVDTLEAQLLACVAGKTSPITMAMYKNFGDPFRHPYRTGKTTLKNIEEVNELCDPSDLEGYQAQSLDKHHLSGVNEPFWRNWIYSDPCIIFLTPEILHHLHRQFWDHNAKWSFKDGISELKQVTGRDHREIQRYIIGVIAGAVTKEFLLAIRHLLDFRYLCQSPSFTSGHIAKAGDALKGFHTYKNAILAAKARTGKKNKPINNFDIPKVELMQCIVPSIAVTGAPMQWSADMTENSYKRFVKEPALAGNYHDQNGQICRTLDRQEKCTQFNIVTATRDPERSSITEEGSDVVSDDEEEEAEKLLNDANEVANAARGVREYKNYFIEARLLTGLAGNRTPKPLRTFANRHSTFHLIRDPHFTSTNIDHVATKFELTDLRPALAEYLRRYEAGIRTFGVGGRRHTTPDVEVGNERVQVWCRVRLQMRSPHSHEDVLPAQTLNAFPPSEKWKFGQCDAVLINVNSNFSWPSNGIKGHVVGQICLILHVLSSRAPFTSHFLAYVQRFDHKQSNGSDVNEVSGMISLKRAFWLDGTRVGDFVPLDQLRAPVQLIPQFGQEADRRLSKESSLECWTHYWLNTYLDKYMFDQLRFT